MICRNLAPRVLMSVALTVTLANLGCSGNEESPTAPGSTSTTAASPLPAAPQPGGSAAVSGKGTLAIRLTDSPFSDAKAVLVTFSAVNVHRSGTGWETLPFAGGALQQTCDLKQLQGPSDLLGVGVLPEGHYTQIRLVVSSASIFFDSAAAAGPCAPALSAPAGDMAPVEIPSGELKLNRQFTVAASGATTILLDFDGDRSIKQTGGGSDNGKGNGKGSGAAKGRYIMTPVIGVVSVQ